MSKTSKKGHSGKKIKVKLTPNELGFFIIKCVNTIKEQPISQDYLEQGALATVEEFVRKYYTNAMLGDNITLNLSVAEAAVITYYDLLHGDGNDRHGIVAFLYNREHNRIASTWTMPQ